jgi:hypothetical protein
MNILFYIIVYNNININNINIYISLLAGQKDHDVFYDTVMKEVSGYDVGNKYMGTRDINLPEMVMQFADIKVASTKGNCKRFRIPWGRPTSTTSTSSVCRTRTGTLLSPVEGRHDRKRC